MSCIFVTCNESQLVEGPWRGRESPCGTSAGSCPFMKLPHMFDHALDGYKHERSRSEGFPKRDIWFLGALEQGSARCPELLGNRRRHLEIKVDIQARKLLLEVFLRFGVVVGDLGEWRPGFYSEFRYASREHSGLAWGDFPGKMTEFQEILTF